MSCPTHGNIRGRTGRRDEDGRFVCCAKGKVREERGLIWKS